MQPVERQEITGVAEVAELPERWTHDSVVMRDASGEVGARRRVEDQLGRFVDELRALGFEELGITGSRFTEHADEVPVEVDDEDLEALRAAAEAGEPGAAERLVFADQMRHLQAMHEGDNLCWVWVHPEQHDVASLERTAHGDWLSVARLHADGALVRTLRRPDGMPEGSPESTAFFVDAPVPGLYALFCRLAGDQFASGYCAKPRILQWDHVVRGATAADVLAAHRAFAASLPLAAAAVPVDMPTVLAMDRRTLHVTHEALAFADGLAFRVWTWIGRVANVAAALTVGVASGSWLAGLGALLLLPWLAGTIWTIASGCSGPVAVLLPLAVVLGGAAAVGVPPAALGVAVAMALVGEVVGRLTFFALVGEHGRRRLYLRLAEPPPVPAAELPRVYRR